MRCRMGAAIGPAVLVTLGVLFLAENLGGPRFHYTWPVLLIVIGLVKVLSYSASSEGHVQPLPPGMPMPMQAPAPPQNVPPAPPATSSGNYSSAPGSFGDQGGHNG